MSRRGESPLAAAIVGLVVVALAGALVAVVIAPVRTKFTVWDDAYMFARYADNLRTEGRLAWNPGGAPTYGLTSVLYLVVVFPARLLLPGDPLRALLASSIVGALAFVGLAVGLAWTASRGLPPVARGGVTVIVLASLLLGGRLLATHATSGMDTTFALAFLATYLLLATRFERDPRPATAIVLGVVGGVALAARPDLLLFTFAVPIALAAAARREDPRPALLALGVTAATVLIGLGAARLYFGSALPLPFYAKSTALYRDLAFARNAAPVPREELARFARANGALLLLALLPLALAPRRWMRETPAVIQGALLAAVAFAAYYLFFVFQLMYFDARFYQPTLPALVLAAAHGASGVVRRWSGGALAAAGIGSLALIAAPLPAGGGGSPLRFARYGVVDSYRALLGEKLFALDRFSLLPDDVVVASTEVGHVGAMNPRKTVIDLAGLNDPAFARAPFSAARLVAKAPDLVYLPHPVYRGMLADVLTDPAFRAAYEVHSADELGTQMGLAIRRTSPRYEAMRETLASSRPPAAR